MSTPRTLDYSYFLQDGKNINTTITDVKTTGRSECGKFVVLKSQQVENGKSWIVGVVLHFGMGCTMGRTSLLLVKLL